MENNQQRLAQLDVPKKNYPAAFADERKRLPGFVSNGTGRPRINTFLLLILVIIALGFVFYHAREILIPIAIAFFVSTLLSPVIQFSRRRFRIAEPVSAALAIIIVIFSLVILVNLLLEPTRRLYEELPATIQEFQKKVSSIRKPLDNLKEVGNRVADIADGNPKERPIAVAIEEKSWINDVITDDLPALSGSLLIILVLTFFLLSSNSHFLRQLTKLGATWSSKRHMVTATRNVRREVSLYLVTITAINACLALVVGLGLYLVDMPNPFFWGIVAGLFNFAPYVGALVTIVLLTLASISHFETISSALIAPGVFLLITTLEGQFITPSIVGRRLSITPTAVFISVIIWTWLWGVAGALMAAPILATTKIVCDNIPSLRSFSYLVSRSAKK